MRKLTKAEINQVRGIEGFPIAKDEDIIALSRPPYYTACPNPFIADFIREHGTPYDEATDDYHREPFAADVSEGKNDPIYNAHSYHTKVPHKAIMRYILHYTKPGDIVFDGFCGTGMTGVAAQMCGCPDKDFRTKIEQEMPSVQWGARKAVLVDLSPAASFISYNYNMPFNVAEFRDSAKKLLSDCEKECGWMYETHHVDEHGDWVYGIDGKPIMGRVNFTVWSDVLICPSCSKEIVYYEASRDEAAVHNSIVCKHCRSIISKRDCEHAFVSCIDSVLGKTIKRMKEIPIFIDYSVDKKRYQKKLDQYDIDILNKIETMIPKYWVPLERMPEGSESRRNDKIGIEYAHQFCWKRSLLTLATLHEFSTSPILQFFTEQTILGMSMLNRYSPHHFSQTNRFLSGTLYVGSERSEVNPWYILKGKMNTIISAFSNYLATTGNILISCQSLDSVAILENSIDYIFTDPPFGGNLNYSELNFLWESWLRVKTNNKKEAVVEEEHHKSIVEYQGIMEECFATYYKALKPCHWITIEFHNSQNSVWNAIIESLQRTGFIIADVRILDKQQGSFKQVNNANATKKDLVISAYKPKESFVREFQEKAGDPEMAWEFVRQHLRNVPVAADGNRDGKLDVIAERQDYLLFDRMVAWHIMNGIPVPMDAHTFYEGLRERFLQRDGMFFLPDQVNEYDERRAHMELDEQQLSFVVTDEQNAIAWLNYILRDGPMTYQQIQPLYLQELHQSKWEKMPELLDMLRGSFLQNEKGAWYIPDLASAADLAKLRRKALLREFYDSCVPGKGKLKVFRMEAIRAGFDDCWKKRDYKTIVAVGERLPESVLQEDPALLMYYDNACSRA